MMRFIWIIVVAIIVGLGIWGWIQFYRPFGEGVKAGELNFVVKKGYVFKTYEGKLIQSGIRSRTTGNIQSNEFDFSIESNEIAETLMLSGGKEVSLHYKEYLGTLPWRGYNKYIVDSIISIRDLPR
jgi:hypothetical protein